MGNSLEAVLDGGFECDDLAGSLDGPCFGQERSEGGVKDELGVEVDAAPVVIHVHVCCLLSGRDDGVFDCWLGASVWVRV